MVGGRKSFALSDILEIAGRKVWGFLQYQLRTKDPRHNRNSVIIILNLFIWLDCDMKI